MRATDIGKFLNGYSQKNYNITPKGWDHVDALVDPFTYVFNTPVMSLNGERPIYYEGYHQSDVIRAKACGIPLLSIPLLLHWAIVQDQLTK
jgi:hypothetical protein